MRKLLLALALAVSAAAVTASASDKLDDLTRRAREGAAKGRLGALRSGLSIYYGDMEGYYPANLAALVPKYIDALPSLELPEHKKTSKIVVVTAVTKEKGKSAASYVKDTGGWLYFSGPKTGELEGTILIDCKHKDAKGSPLSGF